MVADGRTQVFLVVWVAGIVAHQLAFPEELWHGTTGLVSLGIATFATLWPGSKWRYLAALGASSLYTLVRLPEIPNHEVLYLILQGGLLLAWVPLLIRRRQLTEAPLRLVRGGLLIIYFWAAFAKLNESYLDPTVSCSRFVLEALHARVPLLTPTDSAVTLGIVATFLFEFGLPIGLVLRRTRRLAIVLGVGFHAFLAFVPVPGVASFSVLMIAGYVAFLPGEWIQIILDHHARIWPRLERNFGAARIPASGVVALAALVARRAPDLERALDQVAVTAAGGVVLLVLSAVWRLEHSHAGDGATSDLVSPSPSRYQHALIGTGLVLLTMNGAIPYLGGRTQTSFTMFSNIRTENEPNHLLVGRADLLDSQQDLVMVLSSNQSHFNSLIGDRLVVPAAEVARVVDELGQREITLTLLDDGQVVALDDAGVRSRFPTPSWIDLHFVIARPVEGEGLVACRH